jgi:hypothetical protein
LNTIKKYRNVLSDKDKNSAKISSHKTNNTRCLLKEAISQYNQNLYPNALENVN